MMVFRKLVPSLALLLIILFSCTSAEKKNIEQKQIIERVALKGYDVPVDGIAKPKEIVAGEPRIVLASKPTIVKEKEHSIICESALNFRAGVPDICTPGLKQFSQPPKVESTGLIFQARAPEVVVAKNPSSRDSNPNGFSSFGTIQGLKTNQIRSLLQDRIGNLWFSSEDGVTRYDGKNLSHFDISNGVHRNAIVLCMLEDRSGILWFGTFGGGILRFDGREFTQYTENEGLSNNIVNSIIQDKLGNYWIATSGGGVSKFDGKVFTHYTTREGLASNQIRSVFQDKEGAVWIGTFGNGISKFDGRSFFNYSGNQGFPATHIASIFQDRKGNIWFGTYNQGIVKYDGQNFSQFTERQGLIDDTVLTIMQDDDEILWIGTSGGISMFDGKIFRNYGEEDGLSNKYVRCSLIGRQGNLWFGTRDGGLVRFNKNLFEHYTINEGLASNKVLSMLQAKSGDFWFTSFGGGIAKFDGKEFAAYSLKETFTNDFVYTIFENDNGTIWFGSDGGGITIFDGKYFVQYTQNEGLCHNSVRSMLKARNKQIWIGSYGGGVSKFDGKKFVNYSEKEGLCSNKVLCMLEDDNGALWFGTDGGGVSKFDGKKFTRYSMAEGLSNNSISSILQDKEGNIWFGTQGGGLIRFDGKEMITLTKKEGLSNDYITSLRMDKEGNLWIGTRLGPNILKANELNFNKERTKPFIFKNFSYDDGFLGIGCNLNSLLEDKHGRMWIGSTNRLSAIQPKEEVPDTVPPNIQLTNILLFHENVPWINIASKKDTSFALGNSMTVGDFRFDSISKWYFLPENLSLAYDNNFLTFSFIGISQKQTPKIRYQYQLEGLDNHWSSTTDLTEITYANLVPGKYNFKVKAVNSEGIWSKEKKYPIMIRVPWWKSWWFYTLMIIGIVALIYFYIKMRELEHNHQRKLLKDKIDEQTFELNEKYKELEIKNRELQLANSEKDKFFSIIAHDVRGPLSTFMLFTEIMAENLQAYDMNEIQSMVVSMKDSATGLFKLLENLLEWTRMQRGLISFNPEQLNLINVFSDSIETIHQTAKNKSIALVINISSDLEVIADKNMLESVIRNLLSNAIKFTIKGGKVTVRARYTDHKRVEITVSDTGIGMEETMLNDLFKIDLQQNRRGTEGEVSAGLGLLLCKDFVEKQNGTIWAESKEGVGSTFHFTLQSAS
ncbi:MAG: two-component regulator propeller domain-containing protein [Prolixibacteraceae bacterium]